MIKSLRIPLLSVAALSLFAHASAEEPSNKTCPIMTGEETDAEEKVTYQGKDIYFCCGPCVKQFNQEPDYYVALFQEMKSVPTVEGLKVPTEVKLLEQRYCPISHERLVGPSCPSVEYKGVKVYISTSRNVKKWEADPDDAAKSAVEAGVLPQLKGKV
ncbi:MAG TPA: YHS domain-containing protein [Bacteroidia bacterium]|nr:YHS domain-containing protein [Bacteroidia bacterium]